MYLFALLLLTTASAYSTTEILSAQAIDQRELAKLQRGDIIKREIHEPRKGQTFEAHAIFNSSKDRTVEVISDFALYPNFMPSVEKIDILEQKGNRSIINYHLGLPLGKKKRYRLSLIREDQGEHTIIQWKMLDWPEIPNDERIGNTTGFWVLKPFGQNQTLVRYHVYTDPGDVPFGLGWIVDFMSERTIPDVLENTREYAAKTVARTK